MLVIFVQRRVPEIVNRVTNIPKSPTAIAPTKAERRAFSPFSSVVPSSKIWVGLKEDMMLDCGVCGVVSKKMRRVEALQKFRPTNAKCQGQNPRSPTIRKLLIETVKITQTPPTCHTPFALIANITRNTAKTLRYVKVSPGRSLDLCSDHQTVK